MKRDALERMTESEIDDYAKVLGIELAPCETLKEKIDMIVRRRDRSAVISVFGIDFEIPIKRVHDQRVADIIYGKDSDDQDNYVAMELILGEAQTKKLVEACTDDDGVVDSHALGLAFIKIITDEKLKNF